MVRREKGVLPITLGVEDARCDTSLIGIRGGFYHAVTGYSFPNALRLADYIANAIDFSDRYDLDDFLSSLPFVVLGQQKRQIENERFLRLLNRMLFRAAKPEKRYSVLQRFYGLNQGLIERFYAGQLTWRDKARILIGKPPVPVHKALYNLSEKAFIRREKAKRDSK